MMMMMMMMMMRMVCTSLLAVDVSTTCDSLTIAMDMTMDMT